MQILSSPHYDFIRWRWYAIGLSLLIIVVGFGMMAKSGLPLGIDFSGGTIVIVKFDQAADDKAVNAAIDAAVPAEHSVQAYGAPAENSWLIRLPEAADQEGGNLEAGARTVVDALTKANIGKFEVVSTEVVGPVVGRDLQLKGIYATLASIFGITVYIGLRFRFAFALGAIAATFHDVLITLAFLKFFHYDLSLNIVAALLTITGYSVNDTIVIFDRVREDLHTMRKESLEYVVNLAVNQTLSRTIITAGTTFLAVLSLYIFGGEVLEGFAFTMLVGIISGTYSTIFIAAAIAILLSGKQARSRAAAAAKSAAGGGGRGGRKAS